MNRLPLIIVLSWFMVIAPGCGSQNQKPLDSNLNQKSDSQSKNARAVNESYKQNVWYQGFKNAPTLQPFLAVIDEFAGEGFDQASRLEHLYFAYDGQSKKTRPLRNIQTAQISKSEKVLFKLTDESHYAYEVDLDTEKTKSIVMKVKVYPHGFYDDADVLDYFVDKMPIDYSDSQVNINNLINMRQKAGLFIKNVQKEEHRYLVKEMRHLVQEGVDVTEDLIRSFVMAAFLGAVTLAFFGVLALVAKPFINSMPRSGAASFMFALLATVVLFFGEMTFDYIERTITVKRKKKKIQDRNMVLYEALRKVKEAKRRELRAINGRFGED